MSHTVETMAPQIEVFAGADELSAGREQFPDGFRYAPELISQEDEVELLARIGELPFRKFEFHGYVAQRRVVSYGSHYDASTRQVHTAEDIPDFLLDLRNIAAQFANREPTELQQTLITEYGAGAGIGWHRDKAVYGDVVGISLLSPCVFRLRRSVGRRRWERVSIIAEPRSAYLLSGPVRDDWEHSIPSVNATRYSVTFRNLRATTNA